MAVERVQWECPNCRRKYAVRADVPTPTLCPKCDPSVDNSPPVTSQPSRREPDSDFPGEETAEFPSSARFPDPAVVSPLGQISRAQWRQRRYPALRLISAFYRVLAGIGALTAVIGLVYSLTAVITTEPGTERTASVMAGLWMFGIATFASIGLLAFAELIRVFLDIELNTRKE